MTNIQRLVWDYIDNRIEIQKTLLANLLNISSLARTIAKEYQLQDNIDAIISAIRRYEAKETKKEYYSKLNKLLKKAKILTKTKLASLLIKRNDNTELKISDIYKKVELNRDSTLRIFEVTNYIKIIIDDEKLTDVKRIFNKTDIHKVETNLGELTINYRDDITKIPGVFGRIANEMAMNNISIIDSMICQWEHIIIVEEKYLEKAFSVVLNITK